MSNYQFKVYAAARISERTAEKKKIQALSKKNKANKIFIFPFF